MKSIPEPKSKFKSNAKPEVQSKSKVEPSTEYEPDPGE